MDEALNVLVMRKVMDHLGSFRITELTVWLNNDYGEPTRILIENSQKRIDKLRQWAEALKERPVRRAYLGWIDHYQRALNEAKDELRTQNKRRKHEEASKARDAKSKRVHEYAETHSIPEPERI